MDVKHRKNFIAFALAFLLAGCATIGDLRNNPPDLDLKSTKNANDVGVCIADKIESMSSSLDTMNTRKTSNGYSVSVTQNMPGGVFGSGKDTILVVDVTDTQSGSHTLFFNHFLAGGQKYYDIIHSCQESLPVKNEIAPVNTGSESSVPQKIRELESLRKDGVITENEFQSKKKQLLEKF